MDLLRSARMHSRRAAALLLGALGASWELGAKAASPASLPPYLLGEPLQIGNEVQLLMDDAVIEDRWKLVREPGKVIKHLGNPVILRDQPWEEHIGYPCVIREPQSGKFRIYYDNWSPSNYFDPQPGRPSYAVLYAESDNGVNWNKPRLKGYPYMDYERTNVVNMGTDRRRASAAQVMLNADTVDPERRYMMIYGGRGLRLAYSADGLDWRTEPDPLLPFHTDTSNNLVFIPERKVWFMYIRPLTRPNDRGPDGKQDVPEGRRHTGRRVALTTSHDLRRWTPPRVVMYPDEADQPDYDNMVVFRRHGVFIGMYSQMHQERGKSENEVYLASSRDGVHWERLWNRRPFIERGPEGSFDHGQIEVGLGPPVIIGEEEWLYYFATPEGQSAIYQEGSVGLCRYRRDRFVGQTARAETGYLLTKEFVLEGSKLVINCTWNNQPYSKRGEDGIRVAIVAPNQSSTTGLRETDFPGFSLEDCDIVAVDHTSHIVKWKGNSDLSTLKGKRVQLRFKVKNATLYTFQLAQ